MGAGRQGQPNLITRFAKWHGARKVITPLSGAEKLGALDTFADQNLLIRIWEQIFPSVAFRSSIGRIVSSVVVQSDALIFWDCAFANPQESDPRNFSSP
jgi:hypothetical protein